MKLYVLGSSSSGNCYLLRSETAGEVLAIEAGVRFKQVKQTLKFDIASIKALLATHRHADHTGHIKDFIAAGIPTYTIPDVIEHRRLEQYHNIHPIYSKKTFKAGSFSIIHFDVIHDVPCVGFLIRHPECGTVLFATDTCYLCNKFSGLNNILIECNYRLDVLNRNTEAGIISPVRRSRTIKSHMSYDTCLETLQANDLSHVNNILLIHLSADNSHAAEFTSGIHTATGKNVLAATKGMVIEFNKTPY